MDVLSAPQVSFGSSDTFELCEESVEILSATGGYADYEWLKNGSVISGESAHELAVSSPGKYKVKAIQANGCSDSATRFVKELPVTQANVLQSDSQLIATTTAFAYQWLRDGEPIGGATDSTYIAQQSGSFQLVTFNAQNNCQDTSAPKNVTISGIADQPVTDQLSIYPLPANNVINYRLDEVNPGYNGSLTLYNLQGEALRKQSINAGSKRQGSLSIKGIPKGLYILTFQSSKATFSQKIVIGK